MEDVLKRKENESQLEFIKRITLNKRELDLDYIEWGNCVLGESNNYSSENLRKSFYVIEKMFKNLNDENIHNFENQSEDNLIDEIKIAIGELDIKKQEVRNKTNQLNNIKKKFIKSIEISNDLKETIHNEIANFPQFDFKPILSNNEYKLIVCISDWHIGYEIRDYKGNSYNFKIAEKRLSVFISEIKKVCDLYNITDVIVVNLGDSIENTGMRVSQSYECEFDLSTQIVKATQLIFSFISEISTFSNVEFYSVGGNHNRMASGNKDNNLEGDNSNVIITETLRTFIELSNNKRIIIGYTDYKDDSCVFDVNKIKCKAIHGDNRVRDNKKLFDAESTMDKQNYNIILRGHDHNFNVTSQNDGYVCTSGCLFGYNPYSVKTMSCTTNASQTIILVSDKIEFIKDVNLQIV